MDTTLAAHSWMQAALPLAAAAGFLALLLAAAVMDLRRGIVPDGITWGGMAGSLVLGGLLPELHHAAGWEDFHRRNVELFWLLPDWSGGEWRWGLAAACVGMAAGLGQGLFFCRVGRRLMGRGEEVLGMGDVKLLGFIGAFLGWKGACFALLGGALLGIAVAAIGRRGRMERMPFAPFLAVAAAAYLFVGACC